jgi:CRP-like cAMP-binding protein
MAQDFDIRGATVFSGLTPDDFTALAQVGRRESYLPGETVFSGNLRAQSFFVIADGGVEVLRREPDGSQTILARMGRGAAFGEAALLDGHPRRALGIAKGSTTCWVLDARGLARLRAEQPVVATRLVANLARGMAVRLVRASTRATQVVDQRRAANSSLGAGEARRSLMDRLFGR